MIESIRSIPGPYFLIYYAIFSIIVIIVGRNLVRNDYTRHFDLPDALKMDPYVISYFTRGISGTVVLALYKLWAAKKFDFTSDFSGTNCTHLTDDHTGLSPLETLIHKKIVSSDYCSIRTLFQKEFFDELTINTDSFKKKLIELKFTPDEIIESERINIKIIGALILILTGGTKLVLGISNNHPFLFLLLLMIIVLVVFFIVVNVSNTTLGRKFLSVNSEKFHWLKEKPAPEIINDNNIAFGIALFGVSAFNGTVLEDTLLTPLSIEKEVRKEAISIGHGWSGCSGGGCSDSGCGGCGGCGD